MAAGGGSLGKMLGLGFLFGAKDTGVKKTTGIVQQGFDSIGEAVDRLGKETTGLSRFGNAVSALNTLQLSRISDTLDSIADRAGVGIGGAGNQIESFGAQFGLAFKQMTAGMGPFKKEMNGLRGEISSTAFSLQIGGEDLTKSVATLTKSGSTLNDFGLTVRDVGGSMQAQILDGDQLAQVLTELAKGYDLGAKGAKRVLDRTTALGEQFGVGADAARALPEILKATDPILAKFSNLNVDGVTESLTRLAIAAQKRVGGPFQERMEDAISVFNALGESREQMAGLITGLSSDFPDLAKELSIASGDVGQSIESIMADPLTFAKNIQQLMSTMQASDPRLLRLKLSLGKLPAGFQFLVQGGQDAAKALEAASVPVKKFEGSFNKMVRSASGSSRMFAENMEVMKNSFSDSLRKLTSTTDAEVLGKQKRAYDRLRVTLGEVVKEGGVKGALTQAFLDVRRYGIIHGLIPSIEELAKKMGHLDEKTEFSETKLGKWTFALGDAAEGMRDIAVTAGPMLIVLGQLGVFKPISAALGAIPKVLGFVGQGIGALPLGPLMIFAGLGFLIYKNWDVLGPMFGEIWAVLKEGLAPAFEELKIIGQELWDSFRAGVGIIWDDYLMPFGQWFVANLPKMIAAGTVAILKTIAYLKFGFKALGVKAAATIDLMSAGWNLISVILETKVLSAFDSITNVFGAMIDFWLIGFAKVEAFFTGLPVIMLNMIKKIPDSLLKLAGLDVKNLDKTLSVWTQKQTKANDRVTDLERQRRLSAQLDDARGLDRERRVATAESNMRAAEMRETNSMLDLRQQLDREVAGAERAGERVLARSEAAMAARGQVVPQEEEVAAAPTSRKGRGRGGAARAAARQEAAAAVAPAGSRFVTGGGVDPEEFFKKPLQVEFSPKGEEQLVGANVKARKKTRGLRATPNEGAGI